MSQQIWKYELHPTDTTEIRVPENSKILTIQKQKGIPCIWMIVDPYQDNELRVFRILGTGQPVDSFDDLKYIGTFQLESGDLVFHVFEEILHEFS